ncbi:MAG TPA: TIGR02186 family protein [Candidatus Sulfopaludibacter sp.]|nr:TIGR02186 family protein [Candidatus Sulfopaludibacter sp.]
MTANALLAVLFWAGGTVEPPLVSRVTPPVIEVGAFYEGASVKVEGVAAPRSQVILTVTGSGREETFNRKARFGPIWLNAGKVRISGAPSLFLCFSPAPVQSLLSRERIEGRDLDEAAILARIHIEPRPLDPRSDAAIRAEFLALKQKEGIYVFAGRAGRTSRPECEGGPFAAVFHWPKEAPPDDYEIHAYEVRDGVVRRETSAAIRVARVGFPAWLADLAANRAPLYGAAAVVIGAFAGFGIDFVTTRIFRKKRLAAR